MALRLSTGLRNGLLITGSWSTLLHNGVIYVYSGTQPASADVAETGSLLLVITEASGAFTAGVATNGLQWAAAPSPGGTLPKLGTQVWSGVGLAAGTAGWFRFYANARVQGNSTVAVRFDGNIATSGAQINLSSTSVAASATVTIDTFTATIPTL
jgi:hypothetical protein